MRFLLLLSLLVPAITHAQSTPGFHESDRLADPELVFGGALLGASYVGSILWARESEGDKDALYVPIVGPWLELFSLPDCGGDDVFCSHGNATRSVLLLSSVGQLVGTGLVIHALVDRPKEKRVVIAPTMPSGAPGVTLRARF